MLPRGAEEIQRWLSTLRGSSVQLRVPQRGDKKALAETVERNAKEALTQHKLKRAGDFTSRSAALQGIQEALDLDSAPLRIECVDISHVQGTDVVASLVVFEDGLPRKSDYRHYAIKEAAGDGRSDDVASIAEVTRRRFLRHNRDVAAGANPGADIDGDGADGGDLAPEAALDPGPGGPVGSRTRPTCTSWTAAPRRSRPPRRCSTNSASPMSRSSDSRSASRRCGCRGGGSGDPAPDQRIAVPAAAGPRRGAPFRDHVPPQQAITADDRVGPGLGARAGETRRTALVTHFGSVARLRSATVEEITAVPGIGTATAQAVLEALAGSDPAADPAPAPGDAGSDVAAGSAVVGMM